MSNTCKTIVDVSDEWCEFLSKDEATIIIYELTDYRIRMLSRFKDFETSGARLDEVRKVSESFNGILKNICDKIYERFFKKEIPENY